MIDIAYKVGAFLVTLGVLVVFHELGHYLVARWCGVKVLRFSVGFGRVIWARRFGRDGTEWALSAIPLGGYVKMADEREGDVAAADLPRAFNRQNVWKRIAIVAAGPDRQPAARRRCSSPARTWPASRDSARCWRSRPPARAAAAPACAGATSSSAVDDEPVQSWQDLRWRLAARAGPRRGDAVARPA